MYVVLYIIDLSLLAVIVRYSATLLFQRVTFGLLSHPTILFYCALRMGPTS